MTKMVQWLQCVEADRAMGLPSGESVLVFSSYIVWYLFLAGTAAGAFVVASACSASDALRQTDDSEEVAVRAQAGFLAAPVIIAFAALFLLLDLGSPERAWLVVLSPFESIVSTGAWLVALFFALSAAVAVCGLVMRRIPPWFLWLAWIVGSALAFGVMTYTGLLLSDMVSIDFWHSWLLPVLFVASSLATGLALVLAFGVLASGGKRSTSCCLWKASGFAGIAESLVVILFFCNRYGYSDAARASCDMLFTGDLAGFFWAGVVGCGMLVPLVLHVLHRSAHNEAFVFAASAGVLVGGFFVRFCIVGAALYSPLAIGGFA